jgi:hypothetical protein
VSKIRIRRNIKDFLSDEANRQWHFAGYSGSTHIRLRHQSGRTVIEANTPSDVRATKNLLSQMRRIEIEVGTQ